MKMAALGCISLSLCGCFSNSGSHKEQKAHDVAISGDGTRIAVTADNLAVVFTDTNGRYKPRAYDEFDHGSLVAPKFDPAHNTLWVFCGPVYAINLANHSIKVAHEIRASKEFSISELRFPVECSQDGRYLLDNYGVFDALSGGRILTFETAAPSASADFRFVCASSPQTSGGSVALWKVQNDKSARIGDWKTHESRDSIASTAVDAAGKRIAWVTSGGDVYSLDVHSGRVQALGTPVSGSETCLISAKGEVLVVLGVGGVATVNPGTGEHLARVSSEHTLNGAISEDGRRLAVLDALDQLRVYGLPDLDLITEIDTRQFIK
jgi:hypothetical protein